MKPSVSQRIVHGFNQRGRRALRRIYEEFRVPLFAWINGGTGNLQDREDVLADAFTALPEQKNHFDRLSRIRHFFRNFSRNACLNLPAHRAVERSKSSDVAYYYENPGDDEEEIRDVTEHYMTLITGKPDQLPGKSKQIIEV